MKYKLTLIIALIGSVVHGQIVKENNQSTPYIEVIGNASKTVVPDQIFIKVTLMENGKSGAEDPISEQEKRLMENLERIGIPKTRLTKEGARTDYVRINWFNEKQISKSVYILEFKDAKEIKESFSLFKKLKVEQAVLSESTHSRLDSLQQEVEVQAILNANIRANKLLGALDSEVGEPILITQNQSRSNGVYFIDGVKVRGSVQIPNIAYEAPFIEQEPVIEIQKLKIEASILVRFRIK